MRISPVKRISGTVRLPGDKSISHRAAMLTALANGRSVIDGFASSADCASTLGCLQALGVRISRNDGSVVVEGAGLHGLRHSPGVLDCGNSGSTMRMMSGILAGQP